MGIGLEVFERPADVDESPVGAEDPRAYVERVTRAKLAAARAAVGDLARPVAVLVADTTVTIDGDILGKPDSEGHARAMLERLAGRTHEVLTCYALAVLASPAALGEASAEGTLRVVATKVTLRPCAAGELARYVASGEPMGKAGAYAIQGLGAALVERIEGSYTGVVGLPLAEVLQDLVRLGVVELSE